MHWSSGLIALAVVGAPVFAQVSPANPPPVEARSIDSVAGGEVRNSLTAHVRGITQDKQGNMWFATDGEGLCRYDGKTFTYFADKDGLPSNYVRTVQVDAKGDLWITSRDGLCRFDGKAFTRFEAAKAEKIQSLPAAGSLFFPSEDGVLVFDGTAVRFLGLPLDEADAAVRREDPNWNARGLNQYAVYSVHRGRDGAIWFGTESRGVCRYDGKSFTWFRDKDLDKSAVRTIFQDSRGDVWMGNSGVGLFRYDGKQLRNFGDDNGIGNRTWLQGSLIRMPGTIGDPHAITEDRDGNLWIAAFDSSVWRRNAEGMRNFTPKDGINADPVSAIYEDRDGKLWFGTFRGICTWDRQQFRPVAGASEPASSNASSPPSR
ncbi:MAG: hypothetical protein JNK16_00780 [Phycisphaerales bacterium]|nr:hypothetical protein [Phycisphaerales bacterium]